MDVPWAIEELRAFIRLTSLVQPPPNPSVTFFGDTRVVAAPQADIVDAAQIVEQILDRVLPDWRTSVPPSKRRWAQHHEAARRAVAQLERQEELLERLGDSSPQVSLGGLHPWAWDAARLFWSQGAFRVAVLQAASMINGHTQAKVGRYDIADDALMGQVFAEGDPSPGKPRLRLPGVTTDKTQESRQRGARSLAQGCYWALRNPAAHQTQEWPEQVALEALCALSLLARLLDECEVVSVH